MNSKDYPLTLAKDIETLLRNIRRFQLDNSDVVQFVQDAYLVKLKDVSSDFYFIIKNPRMTDKNISSIQYAFLPSFPHTLSPKDGSCNISDIYGILERWIMMIRDYNNIKFDQEDYIQKFYEQEFLEEFEIIDENADIEPFNFEQQEKLNTLLLRSCLNLLQKIYYSARCCYENMQMK
jgi:hypothetical protein